jgi:4-hydroxy-3-methylbut-2-enyl diphosphate reductase
LGFCPGVRRAITRAKKLRDEIQGPIYTDGPLVHNRQVLQNLTKDRVFEAEIDSSFCLEDNAAVLIRTHGISPDRRHTLQVLCQKSPCPLVDATCPHVARTAAFIRHHSRQGRSILLLGDPDHAEMLGLKGYVETFCVVFHDIASIQDFLSSASPECFQCAYALTCQSTLDMDFFEEATLYLRKKLPHLIIRDAICFPTRQRQLALRQALQKGLDGLIVIGGKISANTQKLVAMAHKFHSTVWSVECTDEIKLSELRPLKVLGICSGTSTSDQSIREICAFLRENLQVGS